MTTTEQPRDTSAVPLPEEFAHVCNDGYWLLRVAGTARFDIPDTRFGGHAQSVYSRDQITTYGDAREAAAQHHVNLLVQAITDAAHKAGITRADAVIDGPMLLMLCKDLAEAAGRADAVPAWFGELPAPISNPEAWPANYAGGYNDALNMCYDVIRGHAPQPITTQGEAVENVDHFSSLREAVLAFDENPNGQNSTAVIMRARRLTGSQP